MKDFRELKVWEKAHQLTLQAYRITEAFPKHELFGLASQIRRCSLQFPRTSPKAVVAWAILNCTASCKSLVDRPSELEYHFLLARDLGYMSHADHLNAHKQLLEVKRMLVALTRKVGSERKPK